LLVLVIIMTCALRFIDVRYLLPKREAFQETLEGTVVGRKHPSAGLMDGDEVPGPSSDPDRKSGHKATVNEV
jgi:hypothetical protein